MDIQTPDKTRAIRLLNDVLRTQGIGGVVIATSSVAGMPKEEKDRLFTALMSFDAFTEDNDPHGEHDFGYIDQGDKRFFWKVDYYDRSMEMHSPDPADPRVTKRVLTIMRAEEY